MKIGIVGGGVVGHATARAFLEHVEEVRVYDIDPKKATTHSILHTLASDIIFVCLPTPQKKDALECDTSVVEGFFKEVAAEERERNAHYVLRSTVPIGFTRQMREKYGLINLVHSPEFLTARCSVQDAQIPARNIIGFAGRVVGQPERPYCLLNELYLDRFPHVPLYHMCSDESEAVKLFQNSFFAVKVAFWNELRQAADRMNLDWEAVRAAILADGRIHPSHTQVPGPDGRFGFGGECLPKDLASFVSQNLGYAQVAEAAQARNRVDRERQ